MANKNTDFFDEHGYVKGTYENRLAQLGISPTKKKSGSNVNPGEFSKYIQDYQTNIKKDPSQITGYSGVDSAYEEAKRVYQEMLPSLNVRYSDYLNQLAGEQSVAQQRNQQLSTAEEIAQRNEIAKRGLDVSTGSTFYANQANKLREGQNLRATETDLAFSRERLSTEAQRAQEENAIRSAIAGLTTEQANNLYNIIDTEKSRIAQVLEGAQADSQFMYSANYQKERDKIADSQWQQTFDFTKSEAAADRALEQARLALSGQGTESNYAKDVLSLVENAYSSPNKYPYMRESISRYLEEKYPSQKDTIKEDIKKYFPDGWENKGDTSTPSEVKKIMDELGVDKETATLLLRQEAGL
jgi:hypothetical protein